MTACFVVGTDTGVGKTHVSCALLQALAQHHSRVVGMKPVAAGVVPWGEGWASEDSIALRAASTIAVPPELDTPVLLPDPLSPHIAAARAGVQIDIAAIVQAYQALSLQADAVVVEGAGGFHVPLSPTETGADLAVALNLPMVLVVGLRLGCLNHALLTAEAIAARGLTLAGWVANRVDPDMLAPEENIAWLQQRLGAPPLADIPWGEHTAHSLAAHFQLPADWTR
ncbi:dethiobiotin synthase [Acidovorax sp. 1608163]|uniref:dethiobiotin synthase n=1 Tax=Acidovorax sp. 1608163 TaxID=2478662 RepID=UPI000EF6B0A9|nr:dethiobiotin synthase [Acidovorax sp. 1608163]AYM97100.1 dethiobiotin synthase [Acidovorax sp. 1608163]